MNSKLAVPLLLGVGAGILAAGVLALSPSLAAAGVAWILAGLVFYSVESAEGEMELSLHEVERSLLRSVVKSLMAELELSENARVYFYPSRNGFPRVLIGPPELPPPSSRRVPQGLYVKDAAGNFYLSLPSILDYVEATIENGGIDVARQQAYNVLNELGTIERIEFTERPDGSIQVLFTPRKGLVPSLDPTDIFVNTIGTVTAGTLDRPLELVEFQKSSGAYRLALSVINL